MADLIDRQALYEAFGCIDWWHSGIRDRLISGAESEDKAYIRYKDAIKTIDNAPTVEPKRGEWSKNEWGFIDENSCCPYCEGSISDYVEASETWMLTNVPNFCPNCGAKMWI